jgi:gamma-glutamyltranspeptidase/glutathione hydrolase
MVYRKATEKLVLDYREKAPLAATKDMFRRKGNVIKEKYRTPYISPEPLPVFLQFKKLGSLPIEEI